jgi:two-component system cell cycle response regulator CtrA
MDHEVAQDPESLKAEVVRLRAILADAGAVVPAEWRLTAAEERIFRVLLAVDTATRAAIAEGAERPENRTIDIHIARIREKLKPFGVEIETVRSRGWRLVGRFTWARVLAARPAA